MTTRPEQILFLPGASGNIDFWRPVAARLALDGLAVRHVGWPGFGQTPAEPGVRTLHDLVARVEALIDRPTALVAQSMGGVVALRVALARPAQVTHLALTALSGGFDVARFGARDWRPPRAALRPAPEHLFANDDTDLSASLPSVATPTLLLFGDADPISPPSAGRWLAEMLPRAALHVLAGGAHSFAMETHAEEVAGLVGAWIGLAPSR